MNTNLQLYLLKRMARATAAKWYGHVLQKKEGDIVKKELNSEEIGKREKDRKLSGKNRLKL